MAEALHELGALLVKEHYGIQCSKIFNEIARYSRLSHPQLRQRLAIDRRDLRHGLTRLVKHHILFYSYDDNRTAHFNINWTNTYAIVRGNTMAHLAQKKYGRDEFKVMTHLLHMGHATVDRLAQAFDIEPKSTCENGTCTSNGHANGNDVRNGTTKEHSTNSSTKTSAPRFHKALRRLLRCGFVAKTTQRAYLPAADVQREIEEAVIEEQFTDGKVTGPKRESEFRNAVNARKRKWRHDNDFSEHRDLESGGNKRAKLNGGKGSVEKQIGDSRDAFARLPAKMVLRINHAQYAYALRTARLRQLSEQALGETTAGVYGALLQVLESKLVARDQRVPPQRTDDDGGVQESDDPDYAVPTASTTEIAETLGRDFDLSDSIKDPNEVTKQPDGKKKGKLGFQDDDHRELGIKTEVFSDSEDAPPEIGHQSYEARHQRLNIIDEHLNILQEHEKNFCEKIGGGRNAEWRVDFSVLNRHMINDLIDKTVTDQHGEAYTRIIRLLRDMGKLEDPQIVAIAMMDPKELRCIMTDMQYTGLLDVQEVPKDNKRQPSRTIYLWSHEPEVVRSALLRKAYKSMSRALQRLDAEREHYSDAIRKADMPAAQQEALNRNDREAIMQWKEMEEKIKMQLQRMDEDVTVWRDFSRRDISLTS